MLARVLLTVGVFVCASEATSVANTDGGPLPPCTCCQKKMRARGYNAYCEAKGWHIMMRTAGTKDESWTPEHFGSPGLTLFKSATVSSTGADERTSLGDATGLYDGFFTLTGITKLALVSGDGLANDPASHSHYVVYDLVDGGTGSETLYEIIDRLDTYNKNSPSWTNNDGVFGSPSVTSFTSGIDGYSGTMTSSGGNILTKDGRTPDKICIWGVNRDSDMTPKCYVLTLVISTPGRVIVGEVTHQAKHFGVIGGMIGTGIRDINPLVVVDRQILV